MQAEQDPSDPDGAMSVKANLLIMWGNTLYEHSHLRAAAGRDDWKQLVEQAADKFREAGECVTICRGCVIVFVIGLRVFDWKQLVTGGRQVSGGRGVCHHLSWVCHCVCNWGQGF